MRRLINAALHDPDKLRHLRPWRRHSLVLTVLGFVYILIGATYVWSVPTQARIQSLQVAVDVMPLHFWGWVWIAAGLMAVISSRWPQASETWGYTIMSGLSALWSCFFAWGVIFGAPSANLSGALAWGGIAFLWWAISGLVNPVRRDHDKTGW